MEDRRCQSLVDDALVMSADSHVIEPPNLWTERLDKQYRERSPHIFWDAERQGWFFGCDGLQPALITSLYAVDRTPEEFADHRYAGIEAARAGGNVASERLKDMDRDRVAAEVLYPSLATSLFWLEDASFQRALFRTYNDWLAEFVSEAPERLIGMALISLWDVAAAVDEMYRCRSLGLRGVAVWASAPDERALVHPDNDVFWAAAQDLQMPVGFHILTGYRESAKVFDYRDNLGRIRLNMTFTEEIQHTLTDLIFSGVLERFPNVKLVLAENDIGWVAYHLLHADRIHEKLWNVAPTPLTIKPSEYFKRQVYATFMEDEVGVLTMELLGSGNFMWGSDYPHYESTWPRSQEILASSFAAISNEARRKVTFQNCAEVYGLDSARLRAALGSKA